MMSIAQQRQIDILKDRMTEYESHRVYMENIVSKLLDKNLTANLARAADEVLNGYELEVSSRSIADAEAKKADDEKTRLSLWADFGGVNE
jgi:hypothetical protein